MPTTISERPAYQQRVIQERDELAERLHNLRAFINFNPMFGSLPADECARLRRQRDVMAELLSILDERIANF